MSISKNSTNSVKFTNTRKTNFHVFLEICEFERVLSKPQTTGPLLITDQPTHQPRTTYPLTHRTPTHRPKETRF